MKYVLLLTAFFYTINIGAQFDSIPWEGMNRTYKLHLPIAYDESDDIPLLVAMHGGFGNANNIENQSQLSIKSDQENFIVVYPEGVMGGFFNIRTWNAGWCCGHASESNFDDVGFIDALLDTLINQYSIDTNRIYATGMSNGGFMSYRLACELSERIAAIAPVAASMSMVTCNPTRAVPVMDFHSYLDTNVPYQGGTGTGVSTHYSPPLDSILNAWGMMNACDNINDTIVDNNQYTHIQWSACDCNSEVVQYITRDGGHSWPGGQATPLGDPISNVIVATDLMWDFFEKHSLNCINTATSDFEKSEETIIYPNPSNHIINIDLENVMGNSEISIYDIMGSQVLTASDCTKIDISHLKNGSYVIAIKIDKKILVKKFIKTE